jgi:hypothetical protein
VAIARCEKCGPPLGLKSSYSHRHMAKDGRLFMCGASRCKQSTLYLWLSDAEQTKYVSGERNFVTGSKHGTVVLR